MGFSPDARFPLTYAEKGLLQLRLEGRTRAGSNSAVDQLSTRCPIRCFMMASGRMTWQTSSTSLGFEYEWNEDGIEVKGRAAHAMIPEEGINAIARLCIALNAIGIQSKAINFIAQEIGEDPNATRIFGECADEPSGKLKFNVGKIDLGQTEQLSIDTPHPGHCIQGRDCTKLDRGSRQVWAGI